jgi:hypothetical protein
MPTKTDINAEKLKALLEWTLRNVGIRPENQTTIPAVLFNDAFTQEPESKWEPQKGVPFYYVEAIGSVGCIVNSTEDNYWKPYVEIGNCFQTRELAEQAREAIKVALSNLK